MADRRRGGSLNGFLVAAALVVGGVWASGAFATEVTGRLEVREAGAARKTTEGMGDRAAAQGGSPVVGGCSVFPGTNAWNTDISAFPVHPRSAAMIARIEARGADGIHPDFGGAGEYGIPFVVVPPDQPLVPITYRAYGDESDPGPFPIPLDAPVESGSDAHVLVVQQGTCTLYELFAAHRTADGWSADSGARFDLTSNAIRRLGWTSADAAGLAILAGLVRYEEAVAGEIRHAIRVTFGETRRGFVLPATHFASADDDADLPAMGQRLRLRADFDTSSLTGTARAIAVAMQRYGVVVADNGSDWYVQGERDARWDDDELAQLTAIPGMAFEVVDTGPVRTS